MSSSRKSTLPPPVAEDNLRHRGRSPRTRTPAPGDQDFSELAPLPADAPTWAKRARSMAVALEAAVRSSNIGPTEHAGIERAWAAWQLAGATDTAIARVAHLVDRAYNALRESGKPADEKAIRGCAHVLYSGLPASVRKRTDFANVVEHVRAFASEPDPWRAVVMTTTALLGWQDDALGHAAQAIRVALARESE